MFRFVFLFLLLSGIASAAKPNVLLISIDTLRADHLGCYGYSNPTPVIDGFATKSVLFETAISQVPMTLPSHCTIFTGLYPDQHGVRNNENFVVSEKTHTLATMFSENGYATGAVVGSFSLDSVFGVNRGFEFYEDRTGQGHDPEINRNAERRAEAVWQLGKKWLEKQKGPWFCFLHFFDPHATYTPPAPFPQTYDGEIAYVDRVLGNVLDYLRKKDLLSTTILVLLSDHGESLGEHGESSHGVFLYDATLRVPLMISAPGFKPGRVQSQVRLVDVAPTLLELVGLKNVAPLSGENLVPLMKGRERDLPAYSESYYTNLLMGWAPLHSIRRQSKKWIDAPKQEIYDLTKDPRELKNLFPASAVPKEFRAELNKHSATIEPPAQNKAVDAETQEKLASLGYVTGGGTKSIASTYDPKDGMAVWEKIQDGVAFAQRGKFDQGQKLLEQALQTQPENVMAHKFLAAVLRKKGKDQEAIAHLQTALKSPLHQNDTRCALAEIYLDRKEYREGQQQLQIVRKEEPANIRALRLSAVILLETKQYAEALAEFDGVLKIDPADGDSLSYRGRLLSYLQRDGEALKAYEKLVAVRPLKEEEAIQVAAIYLTSKNTVAAEKYFRVAIEANPKSAQAWKGLALILASKQQWAGAFEAFVNAGDCENAKTMMQKAENLPSKEIETFRKKCP